MRRLRPLANEVLAAYYGISGARLSLLAYATNIVYRVDTADGQCFAMRIHQPDGRSAAVIASEMLWLAAIRRDTNLVVPEPFANRAGEFVTQLEAANTPVRHVVLFHWVAGREITKGLTPTHTAKAGTFLARLHQHGCQFVPPPGFCRPRWDWDRLFGSSSVFGTGAVEPFLDNASRKVFTAASTLIGTVMNKLGEGCEQFGLIHGDFQQWNYLFYRGEVRAIDFDWCGWGHHVFDIAEAVAELRRYPGADALLEGFLEGYRQVRALPTPTEAWLPAMLAAQLIVTVNDVVTSTNPRIRARTQQIVTDIVPWLRGILNSPAAIELPVARRNHL